MNKKPPPRERRSLSGLRGGPVERGGEPRLAALCAEALDVIRADEELPLTHGFHGWPARFHPELPRRLLAGTPGARRVLDPFAGSGTTVVEAVLAGRAALGSDVNPLAVMLARLKATPTTEARRRALAEGAAAIAEEALEEGKAARRSAGRAAREAKGKPRATRFDDPRFYPRHVYPELVTLRLLIDEAAPVDATADWLNPWLREALLLVLSSIVTKVSLQRSDTDPRIVEKHVARGAAARLFEERASQLARALAELSAAVPAGTPAPDVRVADARRLGHVAAGSIDLVITSPPYLGTYDYAAHHQRRFGWLGIERAALEKFQATEIGARRGGAEGEVAAFTRWRADVEAMTAELARVLAPGALAFVLVGDSKIGKRPVPGDVELRRAAPGRGMEVVASAAQQRPTTAGGAKREYLVALRRR